MKIADKEQANTALVGGIAEELGALEANAYPCIFGFVLSTIYLPHPSDGAPILGFAQVSASADFTSEI